MFADLLPIPNPLDWLAEQARDAVSSQFKNAFRWIVERLFDAVGWLFGELFGLLDHATGTDPNATWFTTGPYALMLRVAGAALLGSVMLGIAHAVWHRDGAAGVHLVFAELPKTVVKTAGLLAAVSIGIGFADALTYAFVTDFGSSGHVLADQVGHLPAGANLGAALVVTVVVALVMLFVGLAVLVELLVRAGFIYVLVALAPLAMATDLWQPLRGSGQRLWRMLVGVILAKPMVALCFAIGSALLADHAGVTADAVPAVAEPGTAPTAAAVSAPEPSGDVAGLVGGMLVGLSTLALAAFAPFILLRLVPFGDATTTAGAADAVKDAANPSGGGARQAGNRANTSGNNEQGSDGGGGGATNNGDTATGEGGAAGAKAAQTAGSNTPTSANVANGGPGSGGAGGGAGGGGAGGGAGGGGAGGAAGAAAAGAAV